MEGVEGDAFMDDFDDPEVFFASGAKDKVLKDLKAATKPTHNLTETLNLWSHHGYSSLSYYRKGLHGGPNFLC
jgi:hypothetical protein